MRLVDLRDLLLEIYNEYDIPVYHYFKAGTEDKYIVWAEDSEGSSSYADDKKENQSIQGTIDYFTKTEYDPIVQVIQDKLNSADISWRLNTILYEQDTGYIHYEWTFEIDNTEGG